jgi:hypothetical protein
VMEHENPDMSVVPFSSKSGQGREALWDAIRNALSKPSQS